MTHISMGRAQEEREDAFKKSFDELSDGETQRESKFDASLIVL